MAAEVTISLIQLILSCIITVVTVAAMVVGSYVVIKVDTARMEERVNTVEHKQADADKRSERAEERNSEKLDRIMDKLTELEVNMNKGR